MRKITIPIVTEIVRRFKPVTYWLTTCGSAECKHCAAQLTKIF